MISRKIFAIISVIGILSLAVIPAVQATNLEAESNTDWCQLNYDWKSSSGRTLYAGTTIGAPGSVASENPTSWGLICMMDSVKWITNLLFNIIMIVSVLAILIGAIVYVTAGGRENQLKAAKRILTGAVIGVVIALVAKLVPSVIRGVVGL